MFGSQSCQNEGQFSKGTKAELALDWHRPGGKELLMNKFERPNVMTSKEGTEKTKCNLLGLWLLGLGVMFGNKHLVTGLPT